MHSRFDPSAYLAAEALERRSANLRNGPSESQEVALGSNAPITGVDWPKPAENRRSCASPAPGVATVATIAAPSLDFPWSTGLARFEAMERPAAMEPEPWDELVNEAVVISRRWGTKALECGWHPLDLFGCNPNPYARRLDRTGLVALIAGSSTVLRITDVTPEYAEILDSGSVQRFRRGARQGQVFLWDAYSMPAGP